MEPRAGGPCSIPLSLEARGFLSLPPNLVGGIFVSFTGPLVGLKAPLSAGRRIPEGAPDIKFQARRCSDEKCTLQHTNSASDTGAGAFGLRACTDTNPHANAYPADRHAHACSTHSNAHACSTHSDANAHASSLPYDHHRYGRA